MQELMKPRQDRLAIKLSACHLDRAARAQLPSVASAFIDVAATDSGRATFYNTRECPATQLTLSSTRRRTTRCPTRES